MMRYFIFTGLLFVHSSLLAQFRPAVETRVYEFPKTFFESAHKTIIPGLLTDPQRNYKTVSPVMMPSASFDWRMQNNFFWSGTVTTLSFNKGKFGSYFYWDVQGNLRATRGFIDISGKNRRGFKLVFPWR